MMMKFVRDLFLILNIEVRQSLISALRRTSFPVAAGVGACVAVYLLENQVFVSILAALFCAGFGITLTMVRSAWYSRLVVWLSVGLVWGSGSVIAAQAGKLPDAVYNWHITEISGWSTKDARSTASGNTAFEVAVRSLTCRKNDVKITMEFSMPNPVHKSFRQEPLPLARAFSGRTWNALLILDAEPDIAAGEFFTAKQLSLISPDSAMFFVKGSAFSNHGPVSRMAAIRKSSRQAFQTTIQRISGHAFPLADALLLGIRNDLDMTVTAWFRDAGCAHILALSGQHLSILCSLVSIFIAKMLKKPKLASWVSFIFAVLFVAMAGFSPSLLRALLMFGIGMAATAMDRPQQPIAILSLAFLLALLLQPTESKSLGFMLSYLAMAGLIVFSEPIEIFLSNFPLPDVVSKVLAASLSALCATSLVSMLTFGRLPLTGIITSALAGPILLAFMWSLLLSCIICSILPFVAILGIRIHEFLAGVLLFVMKTGAVFPAVHAENTTQKVVFCAGIVLIGLLLYAYPLLDYAVYKVRRGHKKIPS